jgi:opacity protein-like surface antigen
MTSRTSRPAVCLMALALLSLSATDVLAEEPPNFAEPGLYLAAQVGGAFFRNSIYIDAASDLRDPVYLMVGNEPTYGGRLGYRWKHWGMEVDLDYATGSSNSFTTTLNGRWYPWTGRIQPYLVAGMGFSYIRPSFVNPQAEAIFGGTVFAMRGGGGAEIYITEHWFTDVSTSYLYVTGPGQSQVGNISNDQGYFSVRAAVGYRFF